MRSFLSKTRRYNLVVLFAILSLVTVQIPVQHFVDLGRFQHYAIAVGLFAFGYVAQTIFSWKELSRWARFTYLITALFFGSMGMVFYYNPWLDFKMRLPSPEREATRSFIIYSYMTLSVIMGGIWLKLAHEESKEKQQLFAEISD